MRVRTFGRYELLDSIGHGATGEVFRALDTATDQTVAVKVLEKELSEDPEFAQQFSREMQLAADLHDPHLVPINNYGEISGRLFLDTQLVEGRTLGGLIRNEGGRLSPTRAVTIIEQLAATLDNAHRAGLIHRNVKPSNIRVAAGDYVYLTDFGIPYSAAGTSTTSSAHDAGAYTAPESFSGATDSRADVYSLACVLYKCLTGQQPYTGEGIEQQRAAHLTAPPPRPSASVPAASPTFNAVIAAGMAKNPNARYQTASQLAVAARSALDNRFSPPPSPPPAAPQPESDVAPPTVERQPRRPAPPVRKGRKVAIVGGTAFGIAALIGMVVLVFTTTARDRHVTSSTETTSEATTTSATTTARAPVAPQAGGQLPPFVPSAAVGANCQYPETTDAASKPVPAPRTGKVPTRPARVGLTMVTNQGTVGLRLANNESPCTVNSFVSLAQHKFFDDTDCHRLTTAASLSVLQCGDPTGAGTGGPGYTSADEYPADQYPPDDPALKVPVVYPRGTLAMANSGPNTDGSQFFMVYRDSLLPPTYTVFGKVDATGLATLNKIAADGVEGGGQDGPPATTVTITSVRLD
ncbi:MAG: peptidylprolyl isomerase [Mycobacterium sp.]|nr:peptidylprolyl isomerase [Mycobacterium sp.]